MKKLLIILLISLITSAFGQNLTQDKELFKYVNQYRVKNGVKSLVWSDKLYKTSVNQTNFMLQKNSVFHTYKCPYAENCATLSSSLFFDDKFKHFIKQYFNVDYKDVKDEKTLRTNTMLYIVYMWHNSIGHRTNMLDPEMIIGSISIVMNDIKSTDLTYNNQLTGWKWRNDSKKPLSFYTMKCYSTLDLFNK